MNKRKLFVLASALTALALPFSAVQADSQPVRGQMTWCQGSLHPVVKGASSMLAGMRVERSEGGIVFRDPNDSRFFAYAEVNPLDVLTISLFTRDVRTGERSKVLHGQEIFDRIIKYFNGDFAIFKAHWTPLSDGTLSDNLTEFNRQLAHHTPIEAAELTWTGRQAVRNGLRARLVDIASDGSVTAVFAAAH